MEDGFVLIGVHYTLWNKDSRLDMVYYCLQLLASCLNLKASIRCDLQFNDAAGIDVLPNQAIFDTIQLMGPSSSNPLPGVIPEGSGGIIRRLRSSNKKKAKPVISHHNAWIKSVSMKKRLARKKSLKTKLMQKESVFKQGRKPAKSEPTVHKDPTFDDLKDAIDYMEPEDAHDEGTVKDNEETRVRTDMPKVSTDKLKVSTDKPNEGTAESNEGIVEPKDGNSDESAAPTTVFRDDETIAQFLVTMSQNKTKAKRI
ncbi:hypothetical protein Tco_1316422 [Tanacetum coccineum]